MNPSLYSEKKPIRVLIVDDAALVRDILTQGLSLDPMIEIVGTAEDPYIARDKIVELKPDVISLDVEMPKMDGVEFLRRLMPQYPLPVVMVSSLTQRGKQITLDALEAGAIDFVPKPTSNIAQGLNAMLRELRSKIKIASTVNVSHWKDKKPVKPAGVLKGSKALAESTDKVIAIGASTGGTEAIKKVVARFPATMPGVVIAQHMPAGFTNSFAKRLNEACSMDVKEAESGERVVPGRIFVAPGDYHMTVVRSGGHYKVKCDQGEKVNGHRPSVDVLLHSVAQNVGANAVGVMLTGMGRDGSDGMLAMKKTGAKNVAQDKATSVVFGMPKEAYERGGAERLLPIDEIALAVMELLS